MMNFFYKYPILGWILVGFGILYLLDKYAGFSPIDNLINRVGKYKFKMFSHLNNPKLKQLIAYFNKKQFSNVEQILKSMPASYRAFGFKCLGQYGEAQVTNEWLKRDDNNPLPKIIKAYQLIHDAWEIRGRGTIDTVSNQNLIAYKKRLNEAKDLLLATNSQSEFKTNIASSLLKIYKAIDIDRAEIHEVYNDGLKVNPDDAELHFNYFATISPKWGGTEEEFNAYLNTLNHQSPFVQDLILAQYYSDLVYMQDYKDPEGKIKAFMDRIKSIKFDDNELYKYELYLLLYWLSYNLKMKDYANHFKAEIEPYWED